MESYQVSILVPLYNESENIATLHSRFQDIIEKANFSVEVVFVNDGSTDDTYLKVMEIALSDQRYQVINLSRNFGHQLALSAGLTQVRGKEAVMIVDGDLQDPPELVFDFYKYYKDGYDVIYAIRQKRKEALYKRLLYHYYYRIQKLFSNTNIPLDAGDFSMISSRVVNLINAMPEDSRYLRGLRSWVGFKQIGVPYQRAKRHKGESKYSFRKLLSLAYSGIFNFSELPVKIIFVLGLSIVLISLIYFIYTLIAKFFIGAVPSGFTGLLFTIIMFSGVQLISLGIIGEYVVRIFFQVKNRPLFIIQDVIVDKKKLNGQELL